MFYHHRISEEDARHWPHHVRMPASRVINGRHPSFWEEACLRDGMVNWFRTTLKDDACYYTTEGRYENEERFQFHFFFKNKNDATLFKVYWG